MKASGPLSWARVHEAVKISQATWFEFELVGSNSNSALVSLISRPSFAPSELRLATAAHTDGMLFADCGLLTVGLDRRRASGH